MTKILGDLVLLNPIGSSDFIHANTAGIEKTEPCPAGKNKVIAVDPVWLSWIDTKLLSCKEAIGP